MKKKLSLLLAAIMVVSMVPATAFASTKNRVTKTETMAVDDFYDASATSASAPRLIIENDKGDLKDTAIGTSVAVFELTLTNGEWKESVKNIKDNTTVTYDGSTTPTSGKVEFSAVGARTMTVTIMGNNKATSIDEISIPMYVKATEAGKLEVTVDPVRSEITGGTNTVAIVAAGGTKSYIEKKTDISEASATIKDITITETSKNTLKVGGYIRFKLSSGFKFKSAQDATVSYGTLGAEWQVFGKNDDTKSTDDELVFKVTGSTQELTKLVFSNIMIEHDDAKAGDIASITISGASVEKETLEVGTYVEYGVTIVAAEKDLPVLYSGRIKNTENDTLKVTFKENVEKSWWAGRKTEFTFPTGVKINSVSFDKVENVLEDDATAAQLGTGIVKQGDKNVAGVTVVDNKLTLSNFKVPATKKAKIEMTFNVSIAADFVGDIELTLGGAGVAEKPTIVVAKAVAPVTAEAKLNEVAIDYRNVPTTDITIKEAFAGALEKNKTLYIRLDEMQFESGMTYEIVEGDIKIEELRVDKGVMQLTIKSASSKTPATIKFSGVNLFLGRSLPAGDYALKFVAGGSKSTTNNGVTTTTTDDAFFQNYVSTSSAAKETSYFSVDEVTAIAKYVTVKTAGRDQDDSTFTTKISVTVGAMEMTSGDTKIALDVPAYIENGYTMLPVRAVIEALSGSAIVRWDDPSHTVTISFGSRIVVMTIGSSTMTINGTPVAMSSKAVIKDERTFLPLRDLGYALGLGDSKITWDDATKTATLN